ncbi:glycosyltransferase family 2 protein [uncultured Treponema sp.]|uniref:glycosyltransferase family 2 protein n=1 Tax=uncultured Treponema sp. TaxID=162155 RepID=UPI0025E1EE44|nr:glycosyltransferase family 2 protein [uncultured Treponema sp.]
MSWELDVSIIIVNYNTKELTRNCLKSVFDKTNGISFEVIVSDNGSNDGSVEMIKSEFPQVVLIENNANLGFGAANNRGLKIAKGKYILYLNSDTVLLNNAVKIFFDYWENSPEKEKIGALGCVLQDDKGNVIHSGGDFPTYKKEIFRLIKENVAISVNSLLSFFHIKQIHKKKNRLLNAVSESVDYVTGADLFVRNNSFAEFDERFFLYFEETDLQFKMNKNSLKRILISDPKTIHLEGKSNKIKMKSLDRYISFSSAQILFSRILYFKKNNHKKIWLFIIFILEQLYLFHFFYKTKNMRKKLWSLYVS